MTRTRTSIALATSIVLAGLGAFISLRTTAQPQTQAASTAGPPAATNEMAALRNEIEILKAKASDQAHVMVSVAYHFGNLWFAAQKQNWPLAEFYWLETRAHMRWATRVIPVRKDPEGNEVRLQEILDPIERSVFEDLRKSIAGKDLPQFKESYEQMLDSCHACHLLSGKPFLRLRIPDRPPEPMIRFEPQP